MSGRSLDVVRLHGDRSRTQALMIAHGGRPPVIDLQYERRNSITAMELARVWDHVLALTTMQGNQLIARAIRILVNAEDIHIRSIRTEFRSCFSLLQNLEDQHSMVFERDADISELTRVKNIGETDLRAHAQETDMHSPERVATKVVNVLLKMETTRNAFSRTIRAFACSRHLDR